MRKAPDPKAEGSEPGLPDGCPADAPADRVRGGHDHPGVEADLIAAPGLNLDAGLATEGDGLLRKARSRPTASTSSDLTRNRSGFELVA
ncbi:hypothetical protein SEA_PINKPLASTIC_83 [Mycobacterium phage PinkPlastic]|nr:hypothetical protein SEA_PINKPLASTIC_83 [Mycobacterium phage PinkPlastic]